MSDDVWSIVQAKAKLSEIIRKSKKKPQILQADGSPVAVVLPYESFAEFENVRLNAVRRARQQTLSELASMAADLDADDNNTNELFTQRADREIPEFEDD